MTDLFKWRHYESEIILTCVRWYLRYALSYRDLEEMMTERGLSVDHSTIFRWVQRYSPELDRRCRPHLKQTNDSWRVDETYVKVRGKLGSTTAVSGAAGCTCTEPWIRQDRRSISFSTRPEVPVPPNASSARCWVDQTSPRLASSMLTRILPTLAPYVT